MIFFRQDYRENAIWWNKFKCNTFRNNLSKYTFTYKKKHQNNAYKIKFKIS